MARVEATENKMDTILNLISQDTTEYGQDCQSNCIKDNYCIWIKKRPVSYLWLCKFYYIKADIVEKS